MKRSKNYHEKRLGREEYISSRRQKMRNEKRSVCHERVHDEDSTFERSTKEEFLRWRIE